MLLLSNSLLSTEMAVKKAQRTNQGFLLQKSPFSKVSTDHCTTGSLKRYTEITHDPLLFSVAQGIFWLSTERLSRNTLHLKKGGEGKSVLLYYSVVLQLWHPASALLCTDKIPEGGASTYILHLFVYYSKKDWCTAWQDKNTLGTALLLSNSLLRTEMDVKKAVLGIRIRLRILPFSHKSVERTEIILAK
jgi:hypothetical protein